MKKLQVALLALTASAFMLSACGENSTPANSSEVDVIESTVTEVTETTAESTETVVDDTIPPEEG